MIPARKKTAQLSLCQLPGKSKSLRYGTIMKLVHSQQCFEISSRPRDAFLSFFPAPTLRCTKKQCLRFMIWRLDHLQNTERSAQVSKPKNEQRMALPRRQKQKLWHLSPILSSISGTSRMQFETYTMISYQLKAYHAQTCL